VRPQVEAREQRRAETEAEAEAEARGGEAAFGSNGALANDSSAWGFVPGACDDAAAATAAAATNDYPDASVASYAASSPNETTYEAIFQHAFHELYRRTPALLTELRRYALFRAQIAEANLALELERVRADRAIVVNAEEMGELRDAHSRFHAMRLKLMEALGDMQATAAAAAASRDAMERSLRQAEAGKEAADAKLQALKTMGVPVDDLLASPCRMPGVVELLSCPKLLAMVRLW
jgi:hypothetical protein